MKRFIIFLIPVLIGALWISCEKEQNNPVLDLSKSTPPSVTFPTDQTVFVLTQANAEEPLPAFTWNKAEYNITDLPATKYFLQVDKAINNFTQPRTIVSTTALSHQFTVAGFNLALMPLKLAPGVESLVSFRVVASISDATTSDDLISNAVTLKVTTYEDVIKPIYLLGSGTTVGWNNNAALPMTNIGDGKFARVEQLTPGVHQYIKFISQLGKWAPQWGTDNTGTPSYGPLIYRPTEAVPDPAAIPVANVAGPYYIEADTANLYYRTFLTSGKLFLVGDATPVGWDNNAGIELTQTSPHIFTLTVNLNNTGSLKFLEVKGQWAPQWGTTPGAASQAGKLIYRPVESEPDPAAIPAPDVAGNYQITVELTTMTYKIIKL